MELAGKLETYDVVILGAGYAGLMAALRLRRRRPRLRIALVNQRDEFVERVRLQEAIVAAIPSRIPSISALIAGTNITFICGRVGSLDADRRLVRIVQGESTHAIAFGQAIVALGSRMAVEGVPGAAAQAYCLEPGDVGRSVPMLRSALATRTGGPMRVVVVGGAETGIEAASEIKTAWPDASVTVVSRSRCGSFKGARVEKVVRAALNRLGVTMVDREAVVRVGPENVETSSGRTIACDVCVWSAGLHASPIGRAAGLSTDGQNRIRVDANLRSLTHAHILAVGDAADPVAPTGAPYRLSAFAALASGAYAADVILDGYAQRRSRPFSFSTYGQGVAIGRGGVGFPSYPNDRQAWFVLRGRTAYHVRNFFVWFLYIALKLERRIPGVFFWPGRRRVSWQRANQALQETQAA